MTVRRCWVGNDAGRHSLRAYKFVVSTTNSGVEKLIYDDMKTLIMIIAGIILFTLCNAQSPFSKKSKPTSEEISFINNEKIKYSIVLLACDTCVPITNLGERVIVKVTNRQKKILNQIDRKLWISLLSNTDTDWASNLLLYSIFNRNAHILSIYNNRGSWVKTLKKDDLDYWEKILDR